MENLEGGMQRQYRIGKPQSYQQLVGPAHLIPIMYVNQ